MTDTRKSIGTTRPSISTRARKLPSCGRRRSAISRVARILMRERTSPRWRLRSSPSVPRLKCCSIPSMRNRACSRLQARFRIDGMLQHFNLGTLGDDLSRQRGEVLSRIKILATLDIAERRRPQDGSFRARVEIDGRVVPMDFRVSVIPSYYGENAVIRILDPRGAPDSLAALKLASPVTERLEQLIRSSAGTILVTGPTGSGKSTSLFAIMKSIYRPELKIVTAEDPIEYVCAQFAQHEVNERVGNTFAAYTRAFLRHDPEVIMLGEIRPRDGGAGL